MKSAKLSPEQLAMHLQIIAHATHVQLDMATRLLGGEPDAVLEVLEIIMGVHLMAARMDRDEIATTLDTYAGNVVSLTDLLRQMAAAEATREHTHEQANHNGV